MDWSNHVRSVMTKDQEIISAIVKLHNKGENFQVDPTYSTGRFWEGLTAPELKFDINPQVGGVVQASADNLPIDDNSIQSIMFDPPFVVRVKSEAKGIIHNRFSSLTSIKSLWEFYDCSLEEFNRILKKGGIIAFKCQDTIDGGKEYWSHYEIMKKAESLGLQCVDIFVLHHPSVMFSPNMKIQQHARKTHCYYLVFKKTEKELPEWRTMRNTSM